MTRIRRSWPGWRWVLTGLSAVALGLSAYLSWYSLIGGSVIGCSSDSSCDHVLNSRWSTVTGVLPVSGLAVGTYLAIFLASLFIGPARAAPERRLAWNAMLVLIGAAAGSAVWFTIVQAWIIGAFCPYCMATHITGLLLAALVIWQAPSQFANDSSDAVPNTEPCEEFAAPTQNLSPAAPQRANRSLPAIGVALAGILAACQACIPSATVYRSGESQDFPPGIDPHAVPLVGSPDAMYVVNLLFDYKCPHCQQLHFMLDEAVRRYGGKLAFALCPAPLNSQCNPYIRRDVDEFKDSCQLAKVALAVWLAKREAFPDFNRWMFSLDSGDLWRPRSLDAAKAKAVELVGQAEFDAAQADPWINQYIQTCVRIGGDTIHLDPSSYALPKLVFGSRWVTPELHDADGLVLILHDILAVPRP